jgi:hypothetical protein
MIEQLERQVLSDLKDRVIKELHLRCDFQFSDGSFAAGHNGSYNDEETPIRNTSHMLYALCDAYQSTGDKKFLRSAERALTYLLNNEHITCRGFYVCRVSQSKDATNGVIGHAWLIEALLKASTHFGVEARKAAEKLWSLHHFDYTVGAWAKPITGNSSASYDHTFNHQLWFAACAAELGGDEVYRQITCFIEKNVSRIVTYKNGVLYHKTPVGPWFDWLKIDPEMGLRKLLGPVKNRGQKAEMYLLSAGYHAFNLYAFAMLAKAGYREVLYKAYDINSLLSCVRNEQFESDLLNLKKIGVRYNPSGVEAAFALKILGDEKDSNMISSWLKFQLRETSCDDGVLVKNSPDKATSAARVYEGLRLFE